MSLLRASVVLKFCALALAALFSMGASAQTITAATVPGTSGQVLVLSVAITSGANMDSLAAGEPFRLRLKRDVANDNATGNTQVVMVEIKET